MLDRRRKILALWAYYPTHCRSVAGDMRYFPFGIMGYRSRSFNVCRFGIGSVQQCQCRHFGYVPRSSRYRQFTHRNVAFWYRFGSRSSALAFRHHLRAPNGICNGNMYRSRRPQLLAVSRPSHH